MKLPYVTISVIPRDHLSTEDWLQRLEGRVSTTSYEAGLIQAIRESPDQPEHRRLGVAYPCLFQAHELYREKTS